MGPVITYELENLESIVLQCIAQVDNFTAEESTVIISDLHGESEQIKRKFVSEVFSIQDERQLELYIQYHQQRLTNLIDDLTRARRISTDATSAMLTDLLKLIDSTIAHIEHLLEYLENYFSKYFDLDAKAPKSYIELATIEAIKNSTTLQTALEGKVDSQLIDLALKPLKSFIESSTSKHITYRAIIYIRTIYKELTRSIDNGGTDREFEQRIQTTLVYLNYNTLSYFRYFVANFTNQIAGLNSVHLIERLSYILKSINQLQTKPGVAYNFRVLSLKEQLIGWINEEIIFQEKAYFLHEKATPGEGNIKDGFKLKTDLSVSQLAFMLKLLIEVKIIKNTNTSDLIRFFARSFQTSRQENISYESFRVRYYNNEENTKKGIRTLFLTIVDHINKSL